MGPRDERAADRGRALVACMVVWGGAIAAFGLVPLVGVGLVLLRIARGADAVGTVWSGGPARLVGTAVLVWRVPQVWGGRAAGCRRRAGGPSRGGGGARGALRPSPHDYVCG